MQKTINQLDFDIARVFKAILMQMFPEQARSIPPSSFSSDSGAARPVAAFPQR